MIISMMALSLPAAALAQAGQGSLSNGQSSAIEMQSAGVSSLILDSYTYVPGGTVAPKTSFSNLSSSVLPDIRYQVKIFGESNGESVLLAESRLSEPFTLKPGEEKSAVLTQAIPNRAAGLLRFVAFVYSGTGTQIGSNFIVLSNEEEPAALNPSSASSSVGGGYPASSKSAALPVEIDSVSLTSGTSTAELTEAEASAVLLQDDGYTFAAESLISASLQGSLKLVVRIKETPGTDEYKTYESAAEEAPAAASLSRAARMQFSAAIPAAAIDKAGAYSIQAYIGNDAAGNGEFVAVSPVEERVIGVPGPTAKISAFNAFAGMPIRKTDSIRVQVAWGPSSTMIYDEKPFDAEITLYNEKKEVIGSAALQDISGTLEGVIQSSGRAEMLYGKVKIMSEGKTLTEYERLLIDKQDKTPFPWLSVILQALAVALLLAAVLFALKRMRGGQAPSGTPPPQNSELARTVSEAFSKGARTLGSDSDIARTKAKPSSRRSGKKLVAIILMAAVLPTATSAWTQVSQVVLLQKYQTSDTSPIYTCTSSNAASRYSNGTFQPISSDNRLYPY